ncbi:hypothetical protein QTP70_028647 [Hemibagrus guttatus]|uniref:ribonuclease H n=1 Tax=Hemibagrus guttatus TaxID=175788 RepID=A0AAE0UIT1_9TELE|nr:hypothetical protein QTP70_028647 [Hemibagrus guttatus]
MAALHSERNIRSKIQDFEKQLNNNEISIPTPRPRNGPRPAVAPKPSVTQRASVNSTTEEETNTQMFPGDMYEHVISTENIPVSPAVIPRPQLPRQLSLSSNDQFKPLIKPPPQLPSRPSLRRSTAVNSQDQEPAFSPPPVSTRPPHISHCSTRENDYVDSPSTLALSNLSRRATVTGPVSRKPTIIRVPSRQEQEVSDCFPPSLPVQRGIGGQASSVRHKESFSSACDWDLPPRPSGSKVLPRRPPSAKPAPGRPPPPRKDSIQRNSTLQSNKLRRNPSKKSPVLPPRPNPGHRLYNKYTLEIPHAIAEHDYNGMHTGELSFQKNEVLVLLNQTDRQMFECQVGDVKGTVQKSYLKIITPLSSYNDNDTYPEPQESTSHQPFGAPVENGTLQVQALYDFTPEGPGELMLKAGDTVNNVEQIDREWYLGSSRGMTGFFPINYVKILSRQPAAAHKPAPAPASACVPATPQKVSGPRCLARFDFEGEHSDELSFTEGQVFQLLEYMGEDWARGKIGGHVGIFPLNFVEVLEDLPPAPAKNQTRVPLPDLEKAYDRVPREELWYCMRKSGVAEKYVRVVQDMYERSRTVVRCAVGQTEEFKVEVGLHQGSALSPFLFAIVMDRLSEEVRQESPWTMMFADDIVICSESREQVEENLERWRFVLERRGMKVSGSKTEYMCVNEREGSGTVRLQGEEVKKVQEFKYLGSTVQSNGECGKEVKKRVQAGWNGWRKVSGVLCDREISARIKGKVYRTVVRPAMLYGLETVSLRKRQESELEACVVERVKALYDFAAETESDLPFLRGDVIEVIEHIDEEWSHGRLNGRAGFFPISFTQTHTGGDSHR